ACLDAGSVCRRRSGNSTWFAPQLSRRLVRDPGSDRFPRRLQFLVAAFPCLAPCRDRRAFHFCVTSGRPPTTSGSSCGEADGNGASNLPDWSPQTRRRATALHPRAPCFPVPTSIVAVVLPPCR